MATLKVIPAATAAESPEELALAQATDQVRRAKAARQETVDALTTIRALTQQTTEHTAASRVMEIQNLPGTRVGVFRTVDGTPPTPVANVSRADLARARLAQASAEEAAIVADADLLDAERALTDARRAVARRLLRDALPALTADMDRLLAEVDTVAAKAAAFTAERICPLLEATALAEAIRECELYELALIAERTRACGRCSRRCPRSISHHHRMEVPTMGSLAEHVLAGGKLATTKADIEFLLAPKRAAPLSEFDWTRPAQIMMGCILSTKPTPRSLSVADGACWSPNAPTR
jgi:hypothetical protein